MIQQRDFVKFILLNIITCGIYGIIFWIDFSNDINRACNGDGDVTPNYLVVVLLGIVTCGFYYFYWIYKLGNRIYANGPRYGLGIKETGTTMLLWYVIGFCVCGLGVYVAYYYIIKNANYIFDAYNRAVYGSSGQQF